MACPVTQSGNEVAFSLVSALCNIFYTPAKALVAAVGLPVGAIAGFLNGGDTRAAYAIWVPAAGGHVSLGRGGGSQAVAGRVAGPFGIFRAWIAVAVIALGRVGRNARAELIAIRVVVPHSPAAIVEGH